MSLASGVLALLYRAKQVSMPQPGRCQGFGGATTQIVVFRAIKLKSLLSI
jgi:dihydroxyacid dehydratase/phosphogluconate dehydratase